MGAAIAPGTPIVSSSLRSLSANDFSRAFSSKTRFPSADTQFLPANTLPPSAQHCNPQNDSSPLAAQTFPLSQLALRLKSKTRKNWRSVAAGWFRQQRVIYHLRYVSPYGPSKIQRDAHRRFGNGEFVENTIACARLRMV